MAGRQPEEPPRGPYVCAYCGEAWPSSRSLASHIKAHIKGKAPAEEVPEPFPSVPPGFGPVPRMMPAPAMAPFLLGLGRPVGAPAGLFFRGVPSRLLPQAPPPRDPVVSAGPGGTIRMVVLRPNHAFWAPYRMGMDPPVELDFMGLRPRPDSPSPSFASWLNA